MIWPYEPDWIGHGFMTQACLKASPEFPIAKKKVNTMGNKAFQ